MERLRLHKLVYLASPYSKYEDGLTSAFLEAAKLGGALMTHKVMVFSPITHSHPFAAYGGLNPHDHDMYMKLDKLFMPMCDALAIGMLEGWSESKGVLEEIAIFQKAGKPVYKIYPKTLAVEQCYGQITKVRKRPQPAPIQGSAIR